MQLSWFENVDTGNGGSGTAVGDDGAKMTGRRQNSKVLKSLAEPTFENRLYLCRQNVRITHIDLTDNCMKGEVDLYLVPNTTDKGIHKVVFNVKQLEIFEVQINDEPFNFYNFNQTKVIPPQFPNKSYRSKKEFALEKAQNAYKINQIAMKEANTAELRIAISSDKIESHIYGFETTKIHIKFGAKRPFESLQCVPSQVWSDETTCLAHLLTSTYNHTDLVWFPRLRNYNIPCPWTLEYIVDADLLVVSTGTLQSLRSYNRNDKNCSTYTYEVNTPALASNIGFVVGPFAKYTHPLWPDMRFFCLPEFLVLVETIISQQTTIVNFLAKVLGSNLPIHSGNFVFVNHIHPEVAVYGNLSLLSMHMLHDSYQIDQKLISTRLLVRANVLQIFGGFLQAADWNSLWITTGLASICEEQFMSDHYENFLHFQRVEAAMKDVIEFEKSFGELVLDDTKLSECVKRKKPPPNLKQLHVFEPLLRDIIEKKAFLIMRLILYQVGSDNFLKFMQLYMKNIILSINQDKTYNKMVVTTENFQRYLTNYMSRSFNTQFDRWVHAGGHLKIKVELAGYNEKDGFLSLHLQQLCDEEIGVSQYTGPLELEMQQKRGVTYTEILLTQKEQIIKVHCQQVDRHRNSKNIRVVVRGNLNYKKIDLSSLTREFPILWLILDPNRLLIGEIEFLQPIVNSLLQAQHACSVDRQIPAMEQIVKDPTKRNVKIMAKIAQNHNLCAALRSKAMECIVKMTNMQHGSLWAKLKLMEIIKQLPDEEKDLLLKSKNVTILKDFYDLKKQIPLILSTFKESKHDEIEDTVEFLMPLLCFFKIRQYNSWFVHSSNAAILEALGNIIDIDFTRSVCEECKTRSLAEDENKNYCLMNHSLPRLQYNLYTLLGLYFHVAQLLPTYKCVTLVATFKALHRNQLFWNAFDFVDLCNNIIKFDYYKDVRIAAYRFLVDKINIAKDAVKACELIDQLTKEKDAEVRFELLKVCLTFNCLESNEPVKTIKKYTRKKKGWGPRKTYKKKNLCAKQIAI